MTLVAAPTKPLRLRQLSPAAFLTEYGCDRLTTTILSSRFQYVIEHMCGQLLTNAFSPIIRDFYDFSAALAGPPALDYQTPAVAKSLAIFFGSMRDAVANAVEEYGPEDLRPGDVLMSNDPYRGGTHVNDVCFMRPVFWNDELECVLTIRAHMMDMGGIVPGGFTPTKKNVYETGLVVPPMLLFRNDRPVKSTMSLIYDNTRFGDLLALDFQSIFQSLLLGEQLMHETLERYGRDAVRSTMRYACDVSAETMEDQLEAFPDGVYEGQDIIDCDAVDASLMYRVAVRITKFGSRAEVDFGGSSQQARTCINGAWPDVKAAVAIAFKFLLDPMSPYTSAVTRPIDIVAPPGTVATAMPPDGAVMLYWEALEPTVAAVCRALNAALGEKAFAGAGRALTMHSVNGVHSDGTPWSYVFNQNGGWGATSSGDADSAQKGITSNFSDAAVEAVERAMPALIMRKEYVTDSGGPGRFRGGAGSATDSFFVEAADSYVSTNHHRLVPGDGVLGGRSGTPDGVWAWEPKLDDDAELTPRYLPLDDSAYASSTPVSGRFDPDQLSLSPAGRFYHWGSRDVWSMPRGAVWRSRTAGGGGWGDPDTRDPDAVVRDVRDGYVSVAGAARDYGVVITGDPESDPEAVAFDEAATSSLREQRRRMGTPADAPLLTDGSTIATPVAAVEREPVDRTCPECGTGDIRRYPVLAENGWTMVEKCQACLNSLSRQPWRRLGYIPMIEERM